MLFSGDRVTQLLERRGPVPLRDVTGGPPYLTWNIGDLNPEDFLIVGQRTWHIHFFQGAVAAELAQIGIRNRLLTDDPEELVIIDEIWASSSANVTVRVQLGNTFLAGWNPIACWPRDTQIARTIDAPIIDIGGATAQGRIRSAAAGDTGHIDQGDTQGLAIPAFPHVQLPLKGICLRNQWQLSLLSVTVNVGIKMSALGRELRLQPR